MLERLCEEYGFEIIMDHMTMNRYIKVGEHRMRRITPMLWMRLNSVDHIVEAEAVIELLKEVHDLASPRLGLKD